MTIKAKLFLIGLIFFFCTAQSQQISFDYLGVNDGLSQNSVTTLAQDSLGRIWIGTRDGLNVYDGTQIRTFRPIRGDSTSLLGHFINSIISDANDLWIISKNGLSRLNTTNLQFDQYPKKGLISIAKFKNEVIVGTHRGLFTLNQKNSLFEKKDKILTEELTIQNLYPDRSGTLWIGTDQGLFAYNPDKQLTEKILNTNTTCIFTDSKKQVWVGTAENGVFLLNNQRRQIAHFVHSENTLSIVNNTIRDINEDPNGNIWVGTFLGLSIINNNTHKISNYTNNKNSDNSLSHNSIYSILKDQQGSMWLGTYFGGISYFNPDFHLYQKYPVIEHDGYGISFNVVGEMIEDSNKNLWIATEGGGIDFYDRQNNIFKHYRHEEGQAGLSHNNVKALAFIDKNTLLSGTHMGGINILNIKTGKFQNFLIDKKQDGSLQSNIVDEIIAYQDIFLLGTKSGIIKFDPKTHQLSPLFQKDNEYNLNEKSIICLLEDSFGVLWIGTEEQGLFSYDSKSGEIREFQSSSTDLNSISGNNIACIFEDHQFRLWFGTHGGGLDQYNREKGVFTNYNMAKNNLPSDFIQGIKESRFGNLWIASSKGLSRLDIENNKIYNHSQKNGFPLNEINKGALYLTSDGEIFVGGINGLVSFNEEEMLNRSNNFKLILTSISVNNSKVIPNAPTQILNKDLPYTEKLILKPGQNVFTVNYSACNYISTNQNTYQYQLEGFDTEWINSDDKTSITYTNLNPGDYTLRVRGLSGVEETIIDEKQLLIQINPPLYRTWYAIIAYFLFVIGISWWLNKTYRARLKLENTIKLEKQEKTQIKELNQSKLNFFTNISHEFRTPLTLITGTIESILEDSKTRPATYKKLITTHNNAVRLNNLITELLDFRKLEHGKIKLKVNENDLVVFLNEITQSFEQYAQYHEIKLNFKSPSNLSLWFDKKQLEKVFYNIISNAFKFVTDKTGSISIHTIESQNHIDVIIEDNGLGMPADQAKKIFDRYYQIDNLEGKTNRHGSGIGLALCKNILKLHDGQIFIDSEEGKGTKFSVRLQKGNRHFKEKEFASEGNLIDDTSEVSQPLLLEKKEEITEESQIQEQAPNVLIVEDNPEVQKMLSDLLDKMYNILIASDGNEGIKIAIEHQPDLILSDIMMPNLTGTEMCAKLKRNIQTSHIPIILLTAKSATKFKIEGLETGADDYLTKPFNTKILKARIKNLLQNRMLLQQKFRQDPKAEIKEITTNSIDQKVLKLAKEIVEQNLDNTEFDVQEFAREMGIGRTRLYSKIKGVTGQTPNEFILSTRLKKAADMLLTNEEEMNVSEIAYSVGFSTPRYFSRCFREHFGVSPSRYGKANDGSSVENEDETEN
ncbi:MAG: response regulator [Labilibaculum sp.]|nr:two-component regulator propeller domain-containing protein [Labilibaculum sp.]MBI9057358.1 response regulator [Labilibaculum sp.]